MIGIARLSGRRQFSQAPQDVLGLTPHEYVRKIQLESPDRFKFNPAQITIIRLVHQGSRRFARCRSLLNVQISTTRRSIYMASLPLRDGVDWSSWSSAELVNGVEAKPKLDGAMMKLAPAMGQSSHASGGKVVT